MRLIESDEGDEIAEARYKELRIERQGLRQRLDLIDATKPPPPLLPSAMDALAQDVETLHEMLKKNPNDPATRMALGNLIERVTVHPTEPNQPYDVSLYARHAAYSGMLPIFPQGNQRVAGANTGNAIVPS